MVDSRIGLPVSIFSKGIVFLATVALFACTEPGQTTAVGATAGGVLGAGLGAIVGSQTGNAGAGLAIGTLAGAGTGALIGNTLEAQDKAIRAQDEALERQQQVIAAQRREIKELRQVAGDDKPGRSGAARLSPHSLEVSNRAGNREKSREKSNDGWIPAKGDELSNREKERIARAYASARSRYDSEKANSENESREFEHEKAKVKISVTRQENSRAVKAVREESASAHAKLSWSEQEELRQREEREVAPVGVHAQKEIAATKDRVAIPVVKERLPEPLKKVSEGTEAPITSPKVVVADANGLKERTLEAAPKPIQVTDAPAGMAPQNGEKGNFDWSRPPAVAPAAAPAVTAPVVAPVTAPVAADERAPGSLSPECEKAEKEIQSAEGASETADKLFHFRRALRICPSNADFHIKLAKVYQSLNRPDDATYEFKEALKVDPSNTQAKEQLAGSVTR